MLLYKKKYKNFLILESYFLKYKEFFRSFWFWKYKKSFLLRKYKSFFGASVPWSTKNFLGADFFYFSSLKAYFLKYKKFFRVSVSWNIRNFLILAPKSSISWKYKNFFRGNFFFYFSSPESYFLKCKRDIRLESSISWNIRKFRYARVLNIPYLKYKKVPLCQGSEYTFSEI